MNDELIKQWMSSDWIRRKSLDKEKVKSMIESSITNMNVVKTIPLSEKSAILIFRETYESIRQLGDAKWWLYGYEPRNHEVSMEILKEMNIKEKTKLNHLSRFKKVRNDANYRGFKVTIQQSKEIIDFWDDCSKDILKILLNELE